MDPLTVTPLLLLVLALDLALFAFAARAPWWGLLALLGGLPFNGFLLDVVAPSLGVTSNDSASRFALAGWHDALAIGIVVAAVLVLARRRRLPTHRLEWIGLAVLGWGIVELLLAPGLAEALYAYRTLYVPVAIMLSLVVVASEHGVPESMQSRIAGVLIASAAAAAGFALWQVYVGGFGYLNRFFQTGSGVPAAYFAAFVHQPRAIGTFHSPNEFGAFLTIAILVLLTPAIAPFGRIRPWLGVLLAVALLLTFSRSAWVATIVALGVMVLLLGRRPNAAGLRRRLAQNVAPVLVLVAAASVMLTTTNGLEFVRASLTGHEPSAALHLGAFGDLVSGSTASPSPGLGSPSPSPSAGDQAGVPIHVTLLGTGLGSAGPKSTRFTGAEPVRHSEIWYLDYVAQAGLLGLLIAAGLCVTILAELWRSRRRPWPAMASAVLVALGVGAVFIPVLDEPTVAVPLWAIIGVAVADARYGAHG